MDVLGHRYLSIKVELPHAQERSQQALSLRKPTALFTACAHVAINTAVRAVEKELSISTLHREPTTWEVRAPPNLHVAAANATIQTKTLHSRTDALCFLREPARCNRVANVAQNSTRCEFFRVIWFRRTLRRLLALMVDEPRAREFPEQEMRWLPLASFSPPYCYSATVAGTISGSTSTYRQPRAAQCVGVLKRNPALCLVALAAVSCSFHTQV